MMYFECCLMKNHDFICLLVKYCIAKPSLDHFTPDASKFETQKLRAGIMNTKLIWSIFIESVLKFCLCCNAWLKQQGAN